MNDSTLKHPPMEYKGVPFWALNDSLAPEEMIRQVEEFQRAGMGGFFLHARTGLITKYMGTEWMSALLAAIEKAAEAGLYAWLYDEDKWPSGFAGGIVPLENPDYRGQYLGRLGSGKKLPNEAKIILEAGGWIYFTARSSLGSAWLNGTCYTDLMNPEAVAAYIRSTHEKYKEAFGKYFGSVIPGIFTDEPIMRMRQGWGPCDCELLPYSPYLLERYEKFYGESPLYHVEELFENNPDSFHFRYRYWKTATEQFVETYTKRIAEWCASNNLKLTGHFMYEDSIEDQTRWIGKAMAHYEHMQIPGIDHLGLNINNILTAKQCSSMANQQGKKEVLSEMFGCAGHNMSFEDRKWIVGWHGVMGINFICHHLSLYSSRGCRKRDYPPTFSWHQPYWKDNSAVEEWQSRLSYILRETDFNPEILLIHPAESGWCLQCGDGAEEALKILDNDLRILLNELFSLHYDFDFGDEDFMSRFSYVKDGKIHVGEKRYRYVILPAMYTIRESTLKLLEEFRQSGGLICACGKFPELIDGKKSSVSARLDKIAVTDIRNFSETVKLLKQKYQIKGKNSHNILMQKRSSHKGEFIIMFNPSRHQEATVELATGGQKLLEYGLDSGDIKEITGNSITLAQAQTKVILLTGKVSNSVTREAEKDTEDILDIRGPWNIRCSDLNALPLDFVEWSFDGTAWNPSEPCIALKMWLDSRLYRGPLYLRHRFINNLRTPEALYFAAELQKNIEFTVNGRSFVSGNDFYLDRSILKSDISAALIPGENIIEFKVDYIYGNPAEYENPDLRYGTELETAFILGDFAVYGEPIEVNELPLQVSHDIWSQELPERRLVRIKGPLSIGDKKDFSDGELTLSGYPFYAGTVEFCRSFMLEETNFNEIRFDYLDAITARVWLNGKTVKHLFESHPLKADISGLLCLGENHIKIELRNSLRNLFGPDHLSIGEPCSVGPYSFISRDFQPGKSIPENDWSKKEKREKQISWIDDYFLVRYGLIDGVKLGFRNI